MLDSDSLASLSDHADLSRNLVDHAAILDSAGSGNSMIHIRPYAPADLGGLYAICLATGDAGQDAAHLYHDPKILGAVYAAPYGVFEPENALVAEDAQGMAGYLLGAADTFAFEQRLEAEWWPQLRARHPAPDASHRESWSPDERMRHHIHHPPRMPRRISEPYPAHLHIDLLPRLQGRGLGRTMIDRWLASMKSKGIRGVHLAVGARNARAMRFYAAYGFHEVERFTAGPFDTVVFGLALG